MLTRVVVLAIASSIAHSHVVAQVANALPPVAVTASRSSQPIADLLADVTVIGHDEIVRSGAQSLTEVLQRQPGVEITMNGGPGSTSGAFLRGANRGQTLVLIDGLRVGSSSVGATSLEAIPLDQIERVEILRGPASSLYGADAIGGVIQVFTRRAQGDAFGGGVSAGYGTYDTRNGNATLRGAAGPLAFSITGGGTRSAGYNAIVNPDNFSYNPDRDGYSSENVSGSAVLGWAPGQDLSVQYLRNRLDNSFDAGAPYFDDRTVTTLEAWSVVSRNRIGEKWNSILTVGEGSDDSVSLTAFGESPFKTTQRQYTWQNDWTLPLGALSLAIERREEHVATDSDFAVTQRNTNSATGVYQLRYEAFALQANLRHDNSSQYGGKTTGGIAGAVIGHVPAAVFLIADHPVAAATTLPVLTGFTITAASSPTSPVQTSSASSPIAPPIPIGTLIDSGERGPVGLVAGQTPAALATTAVTESPTAAAPTAAAPTAAAPSAVPPSAARRSVSYRRSSPPVIVEPVGTPGHEDERCSASATEPTAEPRGEGAPAATDRPAAALSDRPAPTAVPDTAPTLRAILRTPVARAPLDTAAPRTTVSASISAGLPRLRPPAVRDATRPLRRLPEHDRSPATAIATHGRSLGALELGGVSQRAPRSVRAAQLLAGDGITVAAGTSHVWDLAWLGGTGSFEATGDALRATFLDRAGAVLLDYEYAGDAPITLTPPDRAARLAVTCLGTSPLACPAACGGVSRTMAPPRYPAACGWQDSSLLLQVAPAALLARGAGVRLLAPLRERRDGQRVAQAVVPAATALAGHRACETTLPSGLTVVLVSLDWLGVGRPDRPPCVAVRGGTLGSPLSVVAGNRLFLIYAAQSGDAGPMLQVSVATDERWQLSGIVGVDGVAAEWAHELAASPGRRLVADGPLSADGSVTVRHRPTGAA